MLVVVLVVALVIVLVMVLARLVLMLVLTVIVLGRGERGVTRCISPCPCSTPRKSS